ncbi:MAG: glyoxalase [Alphaproteobacteria bacterium]|nr:glyoxalase [Alphaproteobacteria bacterium]
MQEANAGGSAESQITEISLGIDVPRLADGIRFYSEAFGFELRAEPVPSVAVMRAGPLTLCLLEKSTGTRPSPFGLGLRHYERHWTPVHLDIHVTNLQAAIARALEAGARKEQVFENAEHGSAAFMSDPFGNGFCLLESRS